MYEKRREAKISLIILAIGAIVGIVFLGMCIFTGKKTVTFKTNGGSIVESVSVKSGNTIDEPKKPKKEGFTFAGWYLDGKEFDFDTEITGDITLVAKWIKVEEKEEETTTSTTTKTTKKTTKKNTLTAKTTKAKTKGYIDKNTSPVKPTTTTTTTTTTTSSIPAQGGTTTTISTTTTTTTRARTNMKIEKEAVTYNVSIDFNASETDTNVISNITNDELANVLNAPSKTWVAFSDNSSSLNPTLDNGLYTYTGATEEVNSFSISGTGQNGNEFNYIIYSVTRENVTTWYIDYPLAKLGSSETDLNAIYFKDFTTAYRNVSDTNTYITLLGNASITSQIAVTKYITIDGGTNKYGFTTTMNDALFKLKNDLDDDTKTVTLKNVTISCISFMDIEDNVRVKDNLLNITGTISYDASGYKFNPETTPIDYSKDPTDPIVQRNL